MLWLYVLVWLLSAVSTYAGLDVLEAEFASRSGPAERFPGGGAARPVIFAFASVALVALGAWLPMGATSCLLLGAGLGGAAYGLVPVMGLESQPAWVRRDVKGRRGVDRNR